MELLLNRIKLEPDVTLGELFVDGVFECFICEDTMRIDKGEEKVHGATCIPAGTYDLFITMSARFQRMLPLLVNVPQFEGIRIHPGNTAADTDGCLLPGKVRMPKGVGTSRVAFDALFAKLNTAKMRMSAVRIMIVNKGGEWTHA